MNHPQPTERQQYWLNHIIACQQQGIIMKAYAEQAGNVLDSPIYNSNRTARPSDILLVFRTGKSRMPWWVAQPGSLRRLVVS